MQQGRRVRHTLDHSARRLSRWFGAAAAVVLFVGWPLDAFAQLPAAHIGAAPLVSPSTSDSTLGSSTTHTNSLSSYSYLGNRPVEIVELADALNNDPDLIFDFVRNNIRTEFRYGAAKGALGALIDRSGTPFDQASLLVELLREAGLSANYVLGTLSPSATEFTDWTGINNAQGACTLLAHGGIPATVNGVTNAACAFAGGTNVTSLSMRHIWVTATIGGTTYVFDPSFKPTQYPSPINLATVAGLTVGEIPTQIMTGATSGTQSGGDWVNDLNVSGVETNLRDSATAVVNNIRAQSTAPEFRTLAGLPTVVRENPPPGGWRLTSHPAGTAVVTWTQIPDVYRTKLTVNVDIYRDPSGTHLTAVRTLYTDEFYGRRFQLRTNYDDGMQSQNAFFNFVAWLEIDDVPIATLSNTCSNPPNNCFIPGGPADLSLSIDHPYAANTGAYMDRSLQRSFVFVTSIAIMAAVGTPSMSLQGKWASERLRDRMSPTVQPGCIFDFETCNTFRNSLPRSAPTGDLARQSMLASWLGQFGRASDVAAGLYGGRVELHDVLGFVSAVEYTSVVDSPDSSPPLYSFFLDARTEQIDAEPAYSVIAVDGAATKRRALAYSVAAIGASLEGSAFEQLQGAVNSASSPARLAWAAAPADEDPFNAGPRRIYDFTSVSDANRFGLLLVEGAANSADPLISNGTKNQLDALINSYVDSGFRVSSSAESLLGPGARLGRREWSTPCNDYTICSFTHDPTPQRGGAIVASLVDANGDPTQIAHVMSTYGSILVKGGGGSPSTEASAFDPSQAADILRDRFVDRSGALGVNLSTGDVAYSTPTLDSVGGGEPYGLSLTMSYQPGVGARGFPTPTFETADYLDRGGAAYNWTSNWLFQFDIGSSGSNALGEHSAEASAASLVALWALSDVHGSALPSQQRDAAAAVVVDWWRRQFRNNSATYSRGASSVQFARLPDGAWQAPRGNFARLTQTGVRSPERPTCGGQDEATLSNKLWPSETRRWSNDGVDYAITLSDGVSIDIGNTTVLGGEPTPGLLTPSVCDYIDRFAVNSLTWPQGPVVTVNGGFGLLPAPANAVTTSLGRSSNSLTATQTANTSGIMTFTNADAATWTYEFESGHGASATQRPSIWPRLIRVWEPTAPNTNATSASMRYIYDGRGLVREAYDAVAIQTPAQREPHRFQIAGYGRGARIDPLSGTFSVVYDTLDRPIRFVDELGRLTTATYDGRGRVLSRTYPELNRDEFAYDVQDNPILFRQVAEPGSNLADLVVTATWDQTWNKPLTVTDARGYRTDLAYYNSGNGRSLIQTATRPAPDGGTPAGSGTRPVYTFAYNSIGLVTSETDPTGRVTAHAYNTLGERTSTTVATTAIGGPALNLTTNFLYTADGDVSRTTDPRGNVTEQSYDAMRRLRDTLRRDGGAAAAVIGAERSNYDALGRVTSTQAGAAFSGSAVTTWQTTESRTYTPTSQVATVANGANNVTTTAYDGLDRVLTVTDPVNRVTRNEYDAASQLTRVIRADGTSIAQDYARYTYSLNGQRLSVRDANNNRSAYVYDGFDRLCRLYFPVATFGANAANTGGIAENALTCASGGTSPDYEGYGYDANGNRTSLRLRSGETIANEYDNLNRESVKNIPGGAAEDVFSDYDLSGRRLSALFSSAGGQGIIYAYDAAGRLISETTTIGTSRALTFQYDAASNRTRITHPDATYFQYTYDNLNRVDLVQENGTTALANYDYDTLGRRDLLTRANAATTDYSYDLAWRLTGLAHDLPSGAADDQTFGLSYTAASQISQRTAANDNYNWMTPTASRSYTRNGLNQYTAISGTAYTYDLRANLTNDGARRFCYDLENRLQGAAPVATDPCAAPSTMDLNYDPLGRLRQTIAGGTTTEFLYDGDRLVAEYAGGSLTTRYAHGPGVDEPLVQYNGAGTSDRRHLITDHQGSVIAENGATTLRFNYGPYGEPNDWNGSRFRYTGQIALPEISLYHYKARVYDPMLGRFLQTDPVGYEADYNLYAYVGNDPLNRSDPTGRESACIGLGSSGAGSCGGWDGAMPNRETAQGMSRGILVGMIGLPVVAVAALWEVGVAALANPVAVTEAIAVAGEIAAPGATLAGGTAALAGRASERTVQGYVAETVAEAGGNPTIERGGQDLFRVRASGHGSETATVTPNNVRNVNPTTGEVRMQSGPTRAVTNRDIKEIYRARDGQAGTRIRTRGRR